MFTNSNRQILNDIERTCAHSQLFPSQIHEETPKSKCSDKNKVVEVSFLHGKPNIQKKSSADKFKGLTMIRNFWCSDHITEAVLADNIDMIQTYYDF